MRQEPDNQEIIEHLGSEQAPEVSEATDQQMIDDVTEKPQETPEEYQFRFKTPEELLQHKWQYKAAGKEVEEPFETILKRASMGYDYAQKMAEFKRQQEEFQPKLEQAEELQKYAEWQKYAQENPDWYDHWVNAWENRGNPTPEQVEQDPGLDIESRIGKILDERLKPFEDYSKTLEEQQKSYETKQADDKLNSDIMKVREQYADIDFDATDPETGKSLEYSVLEFQIQNGLNSFDQALKAFYHDQLIERAVMQQKEQLLKDQQKSQRQGIVTDRSTSRNFDVSKSNYDQLAEHALRSLQKQA